MTPAATSLTGASSSTCRARSCSSVRRRRSSAAYCVAILKFFSDGLSSLAYLRIVPLRDNRCPQMPAYARQPRDFLRHPFSVLPLERVPGDTGLRLEPCLFHARLECGRHERILSAVEAARAEAERTLGIVPGVG